MVKKLIMVIVFLNFAISCFAEIKLVETKDYIFSLAPYLRTDVVTLKNTVDLDSKNSDDSTTYLGFEYSLGLDLKFKDDGPQAYLKLKRAGPYGYDTPLFIHNTLQTSTARMENYHQEDLFPQVEEFWMDTSLGNLPLTLKTGLFAYNVGHQITMSGAYENYGLQVSNKSENLKWHAYYCRPDVSNKNYLGPRIKEEKNQGIDYEHSNAHFFATDISIPVGKDDVLQPYVGVLYDRTNGKRTNLFTTPTHKDVLGTFGISYDLNINKFSLGIEAARNFGEAKSSDEAYKDVEHVGYLVYLDGSYQFEKFKPHSRFILASGNQVTTEMVTEGVTTLTSGKNRAFSGYSPFNTNLADSVGILNPVKPLVAMGNGWGLNYGINRPTTFGDPGLFENIILPGLGFDYQLTDKLSLTFDWWYLKVMEKGIGTYDGISKKLSSDLGNEIDLSFSYALNNNVTLSLLSGYFFPGKYYKEERNDTAGTSLFTPFIRGDGKANGAYQIEISMEVKF